MKKWLCLIIGLLVLAATVEAKCGGCGGEAKEKAASELKKGKCCGTGGSCCKVEKPKCGADCKKPCCAAKAQCDKAKKGKGKCGADCKKSGCAAKGGKKWYNPVSWFK